VLSLNEPFIASLMALPMISAAAAALVLKTLVGVEEMQRIMVQAIGLAKKQE
jgi:hypothetical protein